LPFISCCFFSNVTTHLALHEKDLKIYAFTWKKSRCGYTSVHICIQVCVYICMYICIHTHTHIYIMDTHTYFQKLIWELHQIFSTDPLGGILSLEWKGGSQVLQFAFSPISIFFKKKESKTNSTETTLSYQLTFFISSYWLLYKYPIQLSFLFHCI
jgi:hypothetical protein